MHLGCLDHPGAIGILFEVFRRTDDQTAHIELVQVAVGPSKRWLQHLMQLREVEVARQIPASG